MTKAAADDQSLQLKIDEYGNMLFKLSFLRLQNVQDAEDVVQEVFYRYLKRGEPFESQEHEKAWLIRVTLNACRKFWRSAGKRTQVNLEEEIPELSDGDRVCPADSGPEEVTVRKEEQRRILNAVMSLPAKYRDVIHLFYYEEIPVKEIARITGRGESTVTSQLTRGRGLLKKMLKEEYDFG